MAGGSEKSGELSEQVRQLLEGVRKGDADAFDELSAGYRPLVESLVGTLLKGSVFSESDRDDLMQEASITLYHAAMSYDTAQEEVTFGLYAKICLKNRLSTILRRKKRQLRAERNSLSEEIPSGVSEDDVEFLLTKISSVLSGLEMKVFRLMIRGCSHAHIAQLIGKPVRSVDNAAARIRKKLRDQLL